MLKKLTKLLSIFLSILLFIQQAGFAQVTAQINIAGYLSGLHNSITQDKFRPLHLRYLQYIPQENSFNLLLDKGNNEDIQTNVLEESSKVLLKYFLIGVSLPNTSFWVNLRPDQESNIIDNHLAQTDIGKIMLEADVELKKDTAKATSPDTAEGREYWDKLYKKAEELFGSQNITIPTLTRPWIVPDQIIIRETEDSAYVYKASLKVMLEEDYIKSQVASIKSQVNLEQYSSKDSRLKELNEYSTQLIRELIIPKLTLSVNTSKKYSQLRQVYYSLILAQWFKSRFRDKPYKYSELIDTQDLTDFTSEVSWSKSTYFQQYKDSFAKGEYNIQEPVYNASGRTIRQYFSGGIEFNPPNSALTMPTRGRRLPSSSFLAGMKITLLTAGLALGMLPRALPAQLAPAMGTQYVAPAFVSIDGQPIVPGSAAVSMGPYQIDRLIQIPFRIRAPKTGKLKISADYFDRLKLKRKRPVVSRVSEGEYVVSWTPQLSVLRHFEKPIPLILTLKHNRRFIGQYVLMCDVRIPDGYLPEKEEEVSVPEKEEDVSVTEDYGSQTPEKVPAAPPAVVTTKAEQYVPVTPENIPATPAAATTSAIGTVNTTASNDDATKPKLIVGYEGEFNAVFNKLTSEGKIPQDTRVEDVSVTVKYRPVTPRKVTATPAAATTSAAGLSKIADVKFGDSFEGTLDNENKIATLKKKLKDEGRLPQDARLDILRINSQPTGTTPILNAVVGQTTYLVFEVANPKQNLLKFGLEGSDGMSMIIEKNLGESRNCVSVGVTFNRTGMVFASIGAVDTEVTTNRTDLVFAIKVEEQPKEVSLKPSIPTTPVQPPLPQGPDISKPGTNNGILIGVLTALGALVALRAVKNKFFRSQGPGDPPSGGNNPGGIDFRFLPIVAQSMNNLSAGFKLDNNTIVKLKAVDLDEELGQLEKMTQAGIIPSSERIKEYMQASCLKEKISNDDINKLDACISNILRLEEDSCSQTDAVLRDILIVIESQTSPQQLKEAFLGEKV